MKKILVCLACVCLSGCASDNDMSAIHHTTSSDGLVFEKSAVSSEDDIAAVDTISSIRINNDEVILKNYLKSLIVSLTNGDVASDENLLIAPEVFVFIEDLKVTELNDISLLVYPLDVDGNAISYATEVTLIRPDPFVADGSILSSEQIFSIVKLDKDGNVLSCELYTTNTSHPEYLIWDYESNVIG